MKNTVYLDNSSTTKPCEAAVSAVKRVLEENWGNPSSLHILGFNAEREVAAARESVARIIGAKADEIYFNSCGTEGDNTAIIGAALKGRKRGNRIVTTSIEHPAVLQTVKRLAEDGFEVVYIKPDKCGAISEKDLENAINEKTILVSIMLVNNEVGSIMPVSAAARIIKEKGAPALLHTDAVQAFGKLPFKVSDLGVDLLTVSGHKIHAPKGVGALYIKKGVNIKPYIVGGGQEKGMRSGTENVPLIAGFGAAVEQLPDIKAQLEKQQQLCCYAKEKLTAMGLIINSGENALPYVLNVSAVGYKSETLLHFLENDGIFVSSGSACSKGKGSYVLSEMGLDRKIADSSIRISFSRYNDKEDVDLLCDSLKRATATIRKANV